MIINKLNIYNKTQISFQKKLVPASEYKGPILKLTKKEKAEIDRLYKERAKYELELFKIQLRRGNKRLSCEIADAFNHSMDKINTIIKDIDKVIKDIKISRLTKQKEALKKN